MEFEESYLRGINKMFQTSGLPRGKTVKFTRLLKSKGEKPMICDWIKKNYPKTEDADLIIKWFSVLDNTDSHFLQFLVNDRTQELLELAKKLEAESKEKEK